MSNVETCPHAFCVSRTAWEVGSMKKKFESAEGDFDPERFSPDEVSFDDPDDRLDKVFI